MVEESAQVSAGIFYAVFYRNRKTEGGYRGGKAKKYRDKGSLHWDKWQSESWSIETLLQGDTIKNLNKIDIYQDENRGRFYIWIITHRSYLIEISKFIK